MNYIKLLLYSCFSPLATKRSLSMIIIFLLIFPAGHADAIGVSLGETAPDFSLRTIDGEMISLSEYNNTVLVLTYWRKEQDRSIQALKDGQDIFLRYRGKGVQFFGLTAEQESISDTIKELKENKITFPVLLDKDLQVFGDYGIRVYPSTIIIDKGLIVAYAVPGHSLTYKKLIEGHLRYILGEIGEEEMQEIISPQVRHRNLSELVAWRTYNLALKFTELGLIDQAEAIARKSIDAGNDIAKTHILLGFILLEKGEAESSIKAFKNALELSPNSFDARTGMGGALVLTGDLVAAREMLSSAIVDNPNPHMAYYELGRAYELMGDKAQAGKMYKKTFQEIVGGALLPSHISSCR